MRCEECLPLLEEYADGELDARAVERTAAHLSACAACTDELEELRREQEVYSLYRRDLEVTPAHWNVVRARIEQESDARHEIGESSSRLLVWLREFFGPRNPFRSALVAALVIIVIGVTAVALYMSSRGGVSVDLASGPAQQSQQRPETPPQSVAVEPRPIVIEGEKNQTTARNNVPKIRHMEVAEGLARPQRRGGSGDDNALPLPRRLNSSAVTPDESARIVDAKAADEAAGGRGIMPSLAGDPDLDLARHAERAELLLRSFRNARPASGTRAVDVSYEKEQSRRLLYQNIALRRDAADRGDQSSAGLLETLEPILLDIANLPDRARGRDLRPIEQRMEKKEIVAALQVRTLLASN